MAGPVQGETRTRVIGQGFKPKKKNVDLKWGILQTQTIVKEEVIDYVYSQTAFENIIEGSEEIKAYWYEASSYKRIDEPMSEGYTYGMYTITTPKLAWWTHTHGGPYYAEVGHDLKIDYITAKAIEEEQARQ